MTQEVLADAPAPWRGLTREAHEAMVDAGLLDGAPVGLPRPPLSAGERSVGQPDLAVARGSTPGAHPTTAVPRREVVVHTGPRPEGCSPVVRQPWSEPLTVPVGVGVQVDPAAVLDG